MGRTREPIPPLDIEHIQRAFAVRQDGTLVRRDHHVAALAHEPAAFVGPGNRLMVRVYVNGKTRRVAAGRVAWVLACGEWPKGVVRGRNGDDRDLRPDNLIVTRHGRDPFGAISDKHAKGGRASSLAERRPRTTTLIRTLADHPGATVPQLSRLVGSSVSCCCTPPEQISRHGPDLRAEVRRPRTVGFNASRTRSCSITHPAARQSRPRNPDDHRRVAC